MFVALLSAMLIICHMISFKVCSCSALALLCAYSSGQEYHNGSAFFLFFQIDKCLIKSNPILYLFLNRDRAQLIFYKAWIYHIHTAVVKCLKAANSRGSAVTMHTL